MYQGRQSAKSSFSEREDREFVAGVAGYALWKRYAVGMSAVGGG